MTKYNGFSNRETWCYILHLRNSEELDRLVGGWVKDNVPKDEDVEETVGSLGVKFFKELGEFINALHHHGEIAPDEVSQDGNAKVKLYSALVIDVEDMAKVNPIEVGEMLLEYA